MPRISPAGIVERTVRPYSRSGKVMSSMYFAAPAALSTPSFRRTLRPTALRADAGIAGDYTDDGRLLPIGDPGAVHVGIEHRRVNVALAAHRLGVAKAPGYRIDRAHDVALRLRQGSKRRRPSERPCRQHRAGPRAEALRCEVLAADIAHVGVHIPALPHP